MWWDPGTHGTGLPAPLYPTVPTWISKPKVWFSCFSKVSTFLQETPWPSHQDSTGAWGKGEGVLPHAPHNCQHCLEHLSPMTSSSPPILLEYVPSLEETAAQIQPSLLWGNGRPKAGLLLWFLVPPQLLGLVPLLPSFGERAGPTRRGQSRGRLLPDHS